MQLDPTAFYSGMRMTNMAFSDANIVFQKTCDTVGAGKSHCSV